MRLAPVMGPGMEQRQRCVGIFTPRMGNTAVFAGQQSDGQNTVNSGTYDLEKVPLENAQWTLTRQAVEESLDVVPPGSVESQQKATIMPAANPTGIGSNKVLSAMAKDSGKTEEMRMLATRGLDNHGDLYQVWQVFRKIVPIDATHQGLVTVHLLRQQLTDVDEKAGNPSQSNAKKREGHEQHNNHPLSRKFVGHS